MGGINVKNTIVERVLAIVAPHPCLGCGKVGQLVCEYCKYDIIHEPFVGCFVCQLPQTDGICPSHGSAVQKACIVSQRTGVVKKLVDQLKFHNTKAAAYDAAVLLHESLPQLPNETVVVPVPTVAGHIRQRGYDQVELIARHLATMRGLTFEKALGRVGTATQHKLGRDERLMAAKQAFRIGVPRSSPTTYLLVDDIVTTGATLLAGAAVLASGGDTTAGASNRVIATAIAFQPLD